jgi:hypothetical protein
MQAISKFLENLAETLMQKSLVYLPISILLFLILALLPKTEPEDWDDGASALADACEWLE